MDLSILLILLLPEYCLYDLFAFVFDNLNEHLTLCVVLINISTNQPWVADIILYLLCCTALNNTKRF